jgi:sialic acid synthase SpsE
LVKRDFVFILEAGVNHDGNLERALELVRQASRTGADYIKFQTYSASKIAAKTSPSYWDLNEESTTSQIELFAKYDGFSRGDYLKLAEECERQNIGFMTTCFDVDWVEQLDSIIPMYKVASADITNFQLLECIAKKNKPIILSTGAATLLEIRSALDLIAKFNSRPVTLLHCVLNYPTPAENAALGRIQVLADSFPNLKLGYSDHTKPKDSTQAIQMAYDFGARVFEKHFTWNTSATGNDHYHSFGEIEATKMIASLRNAAIMEEFDEATFVRNQVSARTFARRGLYAVKKLTAGHVITANDVIPLRPPIGEKGFGGNEFFDLIGKRLNSDVPEDSPFLRSYFE